MSDAIGMELRFFIVSILWGIFLLFAYDVIRVFRRLIKHIWFFIALEDIAFWVISAVLVFGMIYEQNNGTIRGFSITGMILGMIVYNQSVSNCLVEWISKSILFLAGKLKKVFLFIAKPIKKVLCKVKKLWTKICNKFTKEKKEPKKRLKKARKDSKIKRNSKKE